MERESVSKTLPDQHKIFKAPSKQFRSSIEAPDRTDFEAPSKIQRFPSKIQIFEAPDRTDFEAPNLNSDPSITRISSNMHISTQFFLSQAARLGTLSAHVLLHIIHSSNQNQPPYRKHRETDHSVFMRSITDLQSHITESCKMVSALYGPFKSKATEQVFWLEKIKQRMDFHCFKYSPLDILISLSLPLQLGALFIPGSRLHKSLQAS
ncbi:hypothetical protein HYC85_014673 [Camellia sinensis]|uniref:Uncharacterized protein n=1 Tax=Camellia sinensis TaxID=4442 RepID=A0A7J7HAB8_CAMSI|nr:hypothetical protein HYC85_014673 [Camellia sinensis]